ncbi:subtilase-type protease inhibitor [Streptoverticillium reticulum]|uniref:subtilase-type protease inhibitor n=1 Tax=Streptoverticillium reticulum TaxID=1433415 RepID=UPI0039BF0CAE
MRYITRGIALGAALALGGGLAAAGTTAASAAPATGAHTQSLYAPSALVLTVGQGDDAASAGIQRAVTLNCTPGPSGTHPAAKAACADLRSAGGDFEKLTTVKTGVLCTKEWNPVIVTAQGVWEGQRVNFDKVFGNPCEMKAAKGTLFEF